MRVDHVKKIWQRRNRNYMREHDHENGARRVPVAMGCHDVITEGRTCQEVNQNSARRSASSANITE